MWIFNNRRPRGYHHVMIYSDERRERLKALEERARCELGMQTASGDGAEMRHRVFDSTGHQRRKRERTGSGRHIVIILMIVVLILLMNYLLTGDFGI